MDENTLSGYTELIELNDELYYIQSAELSDTEYIHLTRPVESLLEEEKDKIQVDVERYL